MPEIKDPVGLSSRIMAAVRAIETQRPDRLFEDPLAALLAGDEIIAEVIPTAKEVHPLLLHEHDFLMIF
jgi:O-methyltransferase involved in polyketide biosynthesis